MVQQRKSGRGRTLVFAAAMAYGSAAHAQTTGEIRGAVVDPGGIALPGATVTVTSAAAGVSGRGGVSDPTGRFRITALPPAKDYLLEAAMPGRAALRLSDIEVEVGRITNLSVVLVQASDVRERVEVRASPSVVDVAETSTTTRFSAEFLEALPILGREYQDTLALAPRVSDVDGDGNPNIHGARDTDVLTQVDGVTTTDPLTGKIGARLNIESIEAIEVKTAGSTAEFGRAQGGTVNILTKSGGNDFEGTFKFFWRGSTLDGDGAGQDSPLLHAGLGEHGLSDLTFNDYLPFLSLSGPIVRDRAWYFAALEYIHREDPVNALSTAFVTGVREWRQFGKITAQVTPSQRLAFSVNHDPQEYLNQGLNSLTNLETGFTNRAGGLLLALRDTAVLSPNVALDSTVAWFDGTPGLVTNLNPDGNRNGALFVDRDGDQFNDAIERDPGEDFDGDGKFDVFEDYYVQNNRLDYKEGIKCVPVRGTHQTICFDLPGILDEDVDGDHKMTPYWGCEGVNREDQNCNGNLDLPDEDRNHNGQLDDFPSPRSTYPFGWTAPIPADRDYTIDLLSGYVSGPYYETHDDDRARGSLRQDLSIFAMGAGTHDVKTGYLAERETFTRGTAATPIAGLKDHGWGIGRFIDKLQHPEWNIQCNNYDTTCTDPREGRITVSLPVNGVTLQDSSSWSTGLYVQDAYHPASNLTLSLGLRFDREVADANGYTPFDPATERAAYDRLTQLIGNERFLNDFLEGNADGIRSLGLSDDPLLVGLPTSSPVVQQILDPLKYLPLQQFTMHRSSLEFTSAQLEQQYPGLFASGDADPAALAAVGVRIAAPDQFAITNNNLAPRLALSWDPWSDGRTKAFATWGRYYDKLFLNTVSGEQGIERVLRYYVYDRDGFDAFPFSEVVNRGNHHIGEMITKSPPSITQVDRSLATPYSDEWTVGLEREIAPEMTLAVRYINRHFRDQLQDVDVNHVPRFNSQTGRAFDDFGAIENQTNPIRGQPPIRVSIRDGRPDLFVRNLFMNEVLRIGNYNESSYHGVELEIRKRLSRRWEMQASYTCSRAQGDAEDFQSRLGNDPSTVAMESGYLDFDQRHVVKLNGLTFLPRDWQLGFATTWSSGLPYSALSRFFAFDNAGYQQFRTQFGTTGLENGQLVFNEEQRNSRRNGSVLDLNVRASKNFVIGKSAAGLFVEAYNLLNSDDLRIYSVDPNRAAGFEAGGSASVPGPLQLDAERRFGRRWQLGFQVAF
ncbi:MAG TPA: carboxypeptidase regulatory-like domain-containing protein [Dongiaceae bacterium]|nr:carboxypeptidase regulatory-like domain-containing protein [Dongiaceae bacterium]